MKKLDIDNIIETKENYEKVITLINKCQDKDNELIEYQNKLKKEIKRLENAKYFLMFAFAFSCFVKFPKVYNYDFLLNYIAILLELMVGFVVDSARFVNKLDLDSTYDTQNFVIEINLDDTKEVLEEEKENVLVKVR